MKSYLTNGILAVVNALIYHARFLLLYLLVQTCIFVIDILFFVFVTRKNSLQCGFIIKILPDQVFHVVMKLFIIILRLIVCRIKMIQ